MKKTLEFIKNNLQYIILSVFFIFLILCEFRTNANYITVIGNYKYLVYFILLIICISTLLGIHIMFKNKFSVEKMFLFLAIPLGLLYIFAVPVGRVPDELNHYYRAYDISRGNLYSKKIGADKAGNDMPDNIEFAVHPTNTYKKELKYKNMHDSKNKIQRKFTNTAIYVPVVYAPQAVGITIGNIFNTPTLVKALLGRIFNYILFLVLTYFSIKIIPFKKYSLLFISLFPVMLQESGSLAADVVTNSVAIFFAAYILKIVHDAKNSKDKKKQLTVKQKTIIASLVTVISLCKFVYLPICLLLFLIPKEKFGSQKKKYTYISILAFAAFIITVITIISSSGLIHNPDTNVNFKSQIEWVMHSPLGFIKVIGKTIIDHGAFYACSMVTAVGAFDIDIPAIYTYLLIILGVVMFLSESIDIKKKELINYALIVFFTVMLIMSVEFASWTPLANDVVEGVQGRYFFPIIIPLIMLFNSKNCDKSFPDYKKYAILSIVMINICVLIRIFYTFL